ncbi:hypothetical protein MalM25_10760 [Planctomycetes bacterium MalM25]|nr:hypothetical protein MalM25_10760 [Planctomycetes bacterium MalM25]
MARHNARLGLVLFSVYALCYAAFVLTNAFAAELMEQQPVAGLNLAVLSGFGLIVLALVLALVYGVAAKSAPTTDAEETTP